VLQDTSIAVARVGKARVRQGIGRHQSPQLAAAAVAAAAAAAATTERRTGSSTHQHRSQGMHQRSHSSSTRSRVQLAQDLAQ